MLRTCLALYINWLFYIHNVGWPSIRLFSASAHYNLNLLYADIENRSKSELILALFIYLFIWKGIGDGTKGISLKNKDKKANFLNLSPVLKLEVL